VTLMVRHLFGHWFRLALDDRMLTEAHDSGR
jgi:hypothetical protein